MRTPTTILLVAAALALAGCAGTATNEPAEDAAPVDLSGADSTARPGDASDVTTMDDADASPPPLDVVEVVDPEDLPPLPDGPWIEMSLREEIPVLLEIPDDRRIAEAYSRGELAVQAAPEYLRHFSLLFQSIINEVRK